MPNQYMSATYHLARQDQLSSGRLVYVEDHEGGLSDIYLHPMHAHTLLCRQFNHVTRHQVGYGLWQQSWTHEGRMQEPTEGLAIAVSRWEIVPASAMPRGRVVIPVEEDGSCIWLIAKGYVTSALRDDMNAMLDRIAGDGLWLQYWYDPRRPTLLDSMGPLLAPPAVPVWA